MVKLYGRSSKKAGMKPGSVVYVGRERSMPVSIEVIDYTATELKRQVVNQVAELAPFKTSDSTSWINVNGLHETDLIEELGKMFDLHVLVQEDIVNTGHRPKFEDSPDSLFVTLKMLYFDKKTGELVSEQVSVIQGKSWVITFQESEGDVFDAVRQRIEKTTPRERILKTDYLSHALIDAVVDNYFVVLEKLGERIEDIEDEISDNPEAEALNTIRLLKKQLIYMRKVVWPLREVIGGFERVESSLISKDSHPYWRDLYEHAIQAIDTIETFRDMVSGLLDLYHTGVSNRMNEVMKVLTIFATIFIPLGFLAGVYGMNFDSSVSPFNMPELGWPFGYIMFWCLAILIGGGLLVYFKRKGWW